MKQAAAGKIYTQSRNSHRQDFTFAYKKGYKRNEMDCGREDLYAVSRSRAVRISHLRIKIIPKGMKWTAAGEIYTQSRDSRRQDFTFAYK